MDRVSFAASRCARSLARAAGVRRARARDACAARSDVARHAQGMGNYIAVLERRAHLERVESRAMRPWKRVADPNDGRDVAATAGLARGGRGIRGSEHRDEHCCGHRDRGGARVALARRYPSTTTIAMPAAM